MSAIYNLEPQPTASAIIHTTLGEISVELFAKQTPLACRNFLQLSLDGYYDNTIFHRLVPGFILQGGDPTGTGNGGESIYDGGAYGGDLEAWPMDERRGKNAGPEGVNFKDEFHSRLKFNRRGLLGMANESKPDTNGSQFFFTLDKTEELNGKNTVFGRVVGDTIYNLAKIGELEIEPGTERPLYPVKITKVEVLVNPFEGMARRERKKPAAVKSQPAAKKEDKKKKKKGGKQLLSFGDEEGEEEEVVVKKKFDTRIAMEDENEQEVKPVKVKKAKASQELPTREAPKHTLEESEEPPTKAPSAKRPKIEEPEDVSESEDEKPQKSALEKANEEIAALKASMRRTVQTEEKKEAPKKTALESMIPESSMRARKRRPGANNTSAADEAKAMKLLEAFRSRLDTAPAEKPKDSVMADVKEEADAAAGDEEAELCDLHFIANCQSCTNWDKQDQDASDDEGWMSHSLSFAADKLGKDLNYRKKAEEELVVIDPRDRERTLQEEKQAKRDARAGKSGRAWDQGRDQARNKELARAAGMGGRGAK